MISKDEAQETWKTMGCGTKAIENQQIYVPGVTLPPFPEPLPPVKIPSFELYKDDLFTLAGLLGYVEDVANQSGVFDVEIRVKFDDTNYWAVLGYGESGDPAIIRFER